MMLSQSVTSEVSQTLLALGDQLYTNHWVEAAHVWYAHVVRVLLYVDCLLATSSPHRLCRGLSLCHLSVV